MTIGSLKPSSLDFTTVAYETHIPLEFIEQFHYKNNKS